MKKLLPLLALFLPLFALAQYPDNIYPDAAHAPFLYGVASGDPMQDKVILWTKVEAKPDSLPIEVFWEIASDSFFYTIINKGIVVTNAERDFTVKIDADRLSPGNTYYYRFVTGGRYSAMGMARTLPADGVKHLKLAVVSCSSIWSGYFNAYRRIAERADIDFVVHLGDYAYDYPDEDEYFRMPAKKQVDCASLADWRERHSYYLLDPDLRAARQNKTWIAEWDNHDVDVEKPGLGTEGIQAFYEYMPIRQVDVLHPEIMYRAFKFGSLAELTMIDMLIYRGKEESSPGVRSVLGNVQHNWFINQLRQSKSTWHLIGNQEMMCDWLSEGAPKFISKRQGNGRVFDPGNWNGYPLDRKRIFDFIDTNHINNVVVLTGDAHMSFIMEMTDSPKVKGKYNHRTGQGSIGVEVLGPSISRGNMDEAGVPRGLVPVVQALSKGLNPHHLWVQFSKHGYTTIDVTPERCVAEFWYSPILYKTDKEKFGKGFTVKTGKNRWERKFINKRKNSTFPKQAQ